LFFRPHPRILDVTTPDTEIAEAIAKGAALITQALYRLQPPGAPTTSEDQLRAVCKRFAAEMSELERQEDAARGPAPF
jgi:hypothetical protein